MRIILPDDNCNLPELFRLPLILHGQQRKTKFPIVIVLRNSLSFKSYYTWAFFRGDDSFYYKPYYAPELNFYYTRFSLLDKHFMPQYVNDVFDFISSETGENIVFLMGKEYGIDTSQEVGIPLLVWNKFLLRNME